MKRLQQLKPNLIKCEDCKDTGWILNQENKAYSKCACVVRARLKEMWEHSGISLDDMNKTFKE